MSVQFFPTYEQVLRSKFGGLVFDVREYGADPLGVEDSTGAIPVGGPTAIRVPAGQTLTPTYTTAPTWVVMGE